MLSDEQVSLPSDWSQDGKYLLYSRGPLGRQEIWALPLEGERKPWLVVAATANTFSTAGHLSPDGRWLAYVSNESGSPEVYVVAFRGGQGKWQVSTNGGTQPKWGRDGKEVYYANNTSRTVFAVPVKEANGALQFGTSQRLVTNTATLQFFYDVSPEGNKILLNVASQEVSQSVTVVTNFSAGLKK